MQDKVLVLRTCFNSYLGADKAHRASDRPTKRSSQHPEPGVRSVPSLGTQHPESGVLISNFSFILPVFVCCSRLSTDNHKRFLIAPAAVDDWLSDFIISAYFAGDKSAYSAKS